jgi:2-polyprenyl-3-methyl-5-hydroxy-6-metoxy-1,4-benzoquinol methylase
MSDTRHLPQKPSAITANIESYAQDIYLNTPLVASNRVEDLMDICALEQLVALADLKNTPHPILEMGLGTGLTLHELVDRHQLQIDVVEGSAALCEQARLRYGNKIGVQQSFFETFHSDKKYHAILALHVLEHVDDPVQVLRNMRQALTPNGCLIALVPNALSLHRRLAVQMGLQPTLDTLSDRDHLVGHQRVFTPSSLAQTFEQAGFNIEKTFGFGLKTLPYSMMESWSDELIRACVQISPELPAELMGNIGLIARRIT